MANLRGELASTVNQREAGDTRLGLLQQELKQVESVRDQLASQIESAATESKEGAALVQSARDALRDREQELGNLKKTVQPRRRGFTLVGANLAETGSGLGVAKQIQEEGGG